MGAINTVKEFVGIAVTAGLSKEIIALLEKKGSLLAEQVSALEKKVVVLESEKSKSQAKVAELQQQLDDSCPQANRLDEVSKKCLRLFFETDEMSLEGIISSLDISVGLAKYHCDLLLKTDLIQQADPSVFGDIETFKISPKGRESIVNWSKPHEK